MTNKELATLLKEQIDNWNRMNGIIYQIKTYLLLSMILMVGILMAVLKV